MVSFYLFLEHNIGLLIFFAYISVGFQNKELVVTAADDARSSVGQRQRKNYETRYGEKKHVPVFACIMK